ncbi:cryptic protein-like isoform X2 [Pseudophryne corroboree]|uniref:cryptic protein-like isoform X2 n=1 Tax=Pseudophryne corroboree TaxID=495146 RepID=UPI0030815E5C
MQYLRFLISIFVYVKYFVKISHGGSCEGLFCHPRELFQSNLSSYVAQLLNNKTSRSHNETATKIPFQGIIQSQTLNKKCCYNGGTCFLGSFCICPKQFTGRQCEYERWPLDCADGILNGEWVVRGCSLCRCFSGELHCLSPVPECDEEMNSERSSSSRLQHYNVIAFPLILAILLKFCTQF